MAGQPLEFVKGLHHVSLAALLNTASLVVHSQTIQSLAEISLDGLPEGILVATTDIGGQSTVVKQRSYSWMIDGYSDAKSSSKTWLS